MIKKLVSLHQIKAKYDKIADKSDPALTRKEPQSPYRLLKILFLDAFTEGFLQLGNVVARTELDVVKAANNQRFWEGVQEAFISHDELHDNLQFEDDEVLCDLHHINSQKIVPHDWKSFA